MRVVLGNNEGAPQCSGRLAYLEAATSELTGSWRRTPIRGEREPGVGTCDARQIWTVADAGLGNMETVSGEDARPTRPAILQVRAMCELVALRRRPPNSLVPFREARAREWPE